MEVCASALVAGYLLQMGKFAISRCGWPILEQQTATPQPELRADSREGFQTVVDTPLNGSTSFEISTLFGSFESLSETEAAARLGTQYFL